MNERIRDLTEQAAGDFIENFKWDYLPEIDKDIFEKFAQLIVQECAYVARQCYAVRAVDAEDVAKHIEETFRS